MKLFQMFTLVTAAALVSSPASAAFTPDAAATLEQAGYSSEGALACLQLANSEPALNPEVARAADACTYFSAQVEAAPAEELTVLAQSGVFALESAELVCDTSNCSPTGDGQATCVYVNIISNPGDPAAPQNASEPFVTSCESARRINNEPELPEGIPTSPNPLDPDTMIPGIFESPVVIDPFRGPNIDPAPPIDGNTIRQQRPFIPSDGSMNGGRLPSMGNIFN